MLKQRLARIFVDMEHEAQPYASMLQAPGAPAGRAIQIATALADLIAEGVPLDAESIAAGILAEAVSVGSLSTRVVEARLGSGVAQLLHDIMRVRALPKRLDIYDDVATRSSCTPPTSCSVLSISPANKIQ